MKSAIKDSYPERPKLQLLDAAKLFGVVDSAPLKLKGDFRLAVDFEMPSQDSGLVVAFAADKALNPFLVQIAYDKKAKVVH